MFLTSSNNEFVLYRSQPMKHIRSLSIGWSDEYVAPATGEILQQEKLRKQLKSLDIGLRD